MHGMVQRSLALAINLVVLVASQAYSAAAAERPVRPPNIVLIIADDMGQTDCGAYGHKTIRTPNIDRLAREGMRFDRAFLTCSSCSPSRSSMITGRYPHNTGAEQLHWPLPADQTTFVELLRKAGYWTASAGKWHLGDAVRDRFDVVHEANPAGFQLPTGKAAIGAKLATASKGDTESGCDKWIPTLKSRPIDKPFFLWLAALDPHRDYEENIIPRPHKPDEVTIPPYLPDTIEVRKDLGLYYDEISRLDRFVGDVIAELDAQGVARNTLVLFTSDNGRPFPRCKTTVYDSGIRTPLIARWPGRIPAGTTCYSLVSSIDLAPTFLTLAGFNQIPPSFQGRSFLPVFSNPETILHEFVYAEHNWHDYEDRGRAVRSLNLKYIRNSYADLPCTPPADAMRSPTYTAMRRLREEGKLSAPQLACFVKPRPAEELYDLESDPHELRNLAALPQMTGELERMRKALDDWVKETDDKTPAIRTPDEFSRDTGEPLPNRVRPRLPPTR
jgi:N-sulfoglucosamine sulfohydrolase